METRRNNDSLSTERNAGKDLQELLKQIFPFNKENDTESFILEMDKGVKAEGELASIVYESCINYIVRRLIIAANTIKKSATTTYKESEVSYRFIEDLRDYLENQLAISENEREIILSLLMLCIENQGKSISNGTKNKIKKEARDSNLGCYICGCSLDYQDPKKPNYAEFEHIWPNRLGGASTYINVRLACSTCNRIKRNYIDASDFHYEQICLIDDIEELERKEQEALLEAEAEADKEINQLSQIAEEAKEKAATIVGKEAVETAIRATVDFIKSKKGRKNINTEFRREYKIALWAKYNYKCKNCKKNISEVGRLKFRRNNLDDSWHFLNINVYCEACLIELQKL